MKNFLNKKIDPILIILICLFFYFIINIFFTILIKQKKEQIRQLDIVNLEKICLQTAEITECYEIEKNIYKINLILKNEFNNSNMLLISRK